jgi:hypothetical protein
VGQDGAEKDHGGEENQFGGLRRSGSHQGKSMMVAVDWRCVPVVMAQTKGQGAR